MRFKSGWPEKTIPNMSNTSRSSQFAAGQILTELGTSSPSAARTFNLSRSFVAQIQRDFRELAALHREDRLFAILDRFQKGRAELATNPRDQFVVEWSLQRHGRFWRSGGRRLRRSAGRSRARRLGGRN